MRDGAVGDVKEDDIEALKIEALKIEEPPPTEAAPIDSIVGGGNDPREMALNCKIVGLKHKVKTLTKENEELKREIEEMKKSAPPTESASPPTESASPPTKNINEEEEEDDIPKCSVCEERSGEYDHCERCYKVFCIDHYNHLCGRFCKMCDN